MDQFGEANQFGSETAKWRRLKKERAEMEERVTELYERKQKQEMRNALLAEEEQQLKCDLAYKEEQVRQFSDIIDSQKDSIDSQKEELGSQKEEHLKETEQFKATLASLQRALDAEREKSRQKDAQIGDLTRELETERVEHGLAIETMKTENEVQIRQLCDRLDEAQMQIRQLQMLVGDLKEENRYLRGLLQQTERGQQNAGPSMNLHDELLQVVARENRWSPRIFLFFGSTIFVVGVVTSFL